MKSISTLLAFLLAAPVLFAQGIEFEHGTWQEALAKAQKENKPIFMDVYTSWCGPCKMLAKEVFPQKTVGDTYNASYINYKVDAEKGEGIELAKKYQVSAYPTLLYLNPDGELLYKEIGASSMTEIIATAQKVLADRKTHKPLEAWEKEYESNQTNPSFILDYLTFRSGLKMNNTNLLDHYFTLTGEEASMATRKVNMIIENSRHLDLEAKAFAYLQKYKDSVSQKGMYAYALRSAVENTRGKAFKTNDEKLMTLAMSYNTVQSPVESQRTTEEEWISFYRSTNQTEKLKPVLISFMDKKLLSAYKEVYNPAIQSEKELSNKTIPMLAQRNIISGKAAQLMSMLINLGDKEMLKKALEWQKQLVEINPTSSTTSLLASVYYKSNNRKKALTTQEQAIALAKDEKNKTRLTEKYNHMKAGDIDDKMLSI